MITDSSFGQTDGIAKPANPNEKIARGLRKMHRPLPFGLRITSWLLIANFLLSPLGDQFCRLAIASGGNVAPEKADEQVSTDKAASSPNRTVPQVKPPDNTVHFSDNPSDAEFMNLRIFTTPLIPIGGVTSVEENRQLAQAITAFAKRTNKEDASALNEFLESRPTSAWRAALLLNIGRVYRSHGFISRALSDWLEAWELASPAKERMAQAIANQAAGELAELYGRLGRTGALEDLLASVKERNVSGPAATKLAAARQGLWVMKNHPEKGFLCGPAALQSIRIAGGDKEPLPTLLRDACSTTNGTSLAELDKWASEMNMHLQPAKRQAGAEIPLPAVIHWKSGHFAAILKTEGKRFLMRDPVFEQEIWITQEAIEDEGSGYYLIPAGALPPGWDAVSREDAGKIWGKGASTTHGFNNQKPDDPNVQPCPSDEPMAQYNVKATLASLVVFDTPLRYQPPRGPAIRFKVTYDEFDNSDFETTLPGAPANMGPNVNYSYFSYLISYGPVSSNVDLFVRGGGKESYTGYDTNSQNFLMQQDSKAILHSTNLLDFVRTLPDGTQEIFDLVRTNVGGGDNYIFLTKIIDPGSNTITLYYDGNYRLTGIGDAIGQVSTVQYVSTNSSDGIWYYKIAQITDPFFTNGSPAARSASFTYDTNTYCLTSITDEIGIVSQFAYSNGLMSSLTTPYGTTSFVYSNAVDGTNGVSGESVYVTDPEGNHELTQFQGYSTPALANPEPVQPSAPGLLIDNDNHDLLQYRNTLFWDKHAMEVAPGDPKQAKIFHWMHQTYVPSVASSILESTKLPLESRVWYNYPGQTDPIMVTNISNSSPSMIARVLDDGSTQLYQYAYSNMYGHVTMAIDPVGRTNLYRYDTNGIDLLQILQQNGANQDILKTITYNNQHLPLTIVDASGQTNYFGYNSYGQLTAATNALQQTVTLKYDSNGYLTNIVGSLPGATNAYTYDNYGRVRTSTDSSGYTLTYDYDKLDRITTITHPDGTYEKTVYQRLDPILQRDRRGHWTATTYDTLRRVRDIRDSLNRLTHFEWCGCGSLESITDPMGKTTTWTRDIEGRPTVKTFPDTSQIQYGYGMYSGRLTSVTDAKNQTTHYAYFADDNLSQVSYSMPVGSTPTVSFTYDTNYNRMLTMADGTGTTAYGYNPITVSPALGAGRLASITNPASLGNSVVSYQYDALSRVTNRAIDDVSVQTSFDTLGRVSLITNILGTFSNSYVGDTFRLSSVLYPNGQGTSFSYFDTNNDLRLQTILNTNSSGGVISKFDYTYDADGQIQTWTRQADTTFTNTFTFNYDPVDQLLGAVLAPTGVATNILNQYVYSYDSSGNRTGQQIGATATGANYNNLNQLYNIVSNGLTQFSGNITKTGVVAVAGVSAVMTNQTNFASYVTTTNGTNLIQINAIDQNLNTAVTNYQLVVSNNGVIATLVYDLNGNLVTNMTATATNTYEWDAANRLTAINEAGTNRSEFTYDGAGRRVKIVEKTNNVTYSTKTFVWCGTELCEERNSAGTTVTRRFFGQGEQISGTNYYFTRDHLVNIREMTDTGGAIHVRYDYDPYGTRTKISGDLDADFGFTGHYLHQDSGLYLTLYRAYDPATGRWISRDPIGESGGMNRYNYVLNDPVNLVDFLGLKYAELYGASGVAAGVVMAAGLSVPADAATGGANIAATPGELALGGAIGGYVGYAAGWWIDLFAGNTTISGTPPPTTMDKTVRQRTGIPKPKTCPPGTQPIDTTPWKDKVHKIKPQIGAGASDWVGISPEGDVITGDAEGNPVNHGPAENYVPRPPQKPTENEEGGNINPQEGD